MQYSLLINVFVVGIGAFFFFLTSIWIVKDKLRAENPELSDDAMRANPGETKEMLCVIENGDLEDSINSDDIPPTMILSKPEQNNSINDCKFDTARNVSLTKKLDESAISKFQRLLETPDTSNEKLNTGHISTSSSTPPSPATPKSLRV